MGGIDSKYGKGETCMQNFGWKTRREETTLKTRT